MAVDFARSNESSRRCDEILALRDKLELHEREAIAGYLRATIVFAIMEHCRDVIDTAFESPGGSAVMTDGSYYWRLDAAEYVAHYGIDLPADFLERGRARSWEPSRVTSEDAIRIDRYLVTHGRRIESKQRANSGLTGNDRVYQRAGDLYEPTRKLLHFGERNYDLSRPMRKTVLWTRTP